MKNINEKSQQKIFTKARTFNKWTKDKVSEKDLVKLYNLMKYGPTSSNCCPLRVIFITTKKEKEKLLECMSKGNVEKTRQAPVTALLCEDLKFYEKMNKLVPYRDTSKDFKGNDDLIKETAFRNSSLQGAYFIIAARSIGLDCGPMSGFDKDKVNKAFCKGSSWEVNFICNLGYGDRKDMFARSPRLDFNEACKII